MVSTQLENISQNGNLPQIGVKIKHIWNHHPDNQWDNCRFLITLCRTISLNCENFAHFMNSLSWFACETLDAIVSTMAKPWEPLKVKTKKHLSYPLWGVYSWPFRGWKRDLHLGDQSRSRMEEAGRDPISLKTSGKRSHSCSWKIPLWNH